MPATQPLITVLDVTDLVRIAPFAELDPAVLYELLRLRAEVFVVEQDCAFLDLDGRDTEPAAIAPLARTRTDGWSATPASCPATT